MKRLVVTILSSGILILNGCGGSTEGKEKEVKKDTFYYTKKLNRATSIQALHTDKTVLFTINSLEKSLNQIAIDINKSSIAEIVYQLHYSLENQVKNVNNFTFTKDTAIILEKNIKLEAIRKNRKSTRALSKYKKVGLLYELNKASKKIIGKNISDNLPNNFSEILNNNEDVNEDNNTQQYISFAPPLSKELVCPSLGVCRDKSPIKQWKRGGLAEVQKLRREYKKELDIVTNSDTKMAQNLNIKNQRTWSCPSDGYSISVTNYKNGTSILEFAGSSYRSYLTKSLTSYRPFDIHESFIIQNAPSNNQQHAVCMTDGNWIGSGEIYYYVSKDNHASWTNTSAHWEGFVNLPILDIDNAAMALNLFQFKLSSTANGALPTSCHDIECSNGGSSQGHGNEVEIDSMNRVSMVEFGMNNPGLSGQDIFNFFRGDAWGTHQSDLTGLSLNWINTLDNLGIINSAVIAQEIRNSWNNNDGFIFRKLEIKHYSTFDFTPVDENVEELLLLPRQKNFNTSGSYPTNLFYDEIPPIRIMPWGRPNPNYCAEIDPASNVYIPVYLVDSEVLLELTTEVEYLKETQLYKLEDEKNINIWEQYETVTNQKYEPISGHGYIGYKEDNTLSYPPRLKYDCHMTENKKGGGLSIEKCETKDEAYYDTLIDRLIILNPILHGNKFNHPCLQPAIPNPWLL